MDSTVRNRFLAVLLVGTMLLAGCGGGGSGSPTDASPTAVQYHDDASTYLLDASEFGEDWSAVDEYEADISADGAESGQVIDLTSDAGNATVTLVTFESPSAAKTQVDNKRDEYRGQGLQVRNEDVGDYAISTVSFANSYDADILVEVQRSNVYVQVKGTIERSTALDMAETQLETFEE